MTLRWRIAQWFELRWWQNYLRDKDNDAYKTWKKNYWLNLIDRIGSEINLAQSKTIADLGCGPAGIFMVFPDKEVTAIDPLIDTYEARTTFFKKNDYPNTTFVNSTIEDFEPAPTVSAGSPFPALRNGDPAGLKGESKYDMVFCMNAINHVHDIKEAFEKLKGICKDDGAIVISIDAHNHSFFKHLFRAVPGDILHPHQYDLGEYVSMLSVGGWKVGGPILLKKEFFFGHYLLVAKK